MIFIVKDIQWTISIIENQWKTIINPQYQLTKAQSFYILHKKDYGSWDYTKKRYLWTVPLLFSIIGKGPITILQIVRNENYENKDNLMSYLMIWNIVVFTIPILILLILYLLIPKFHDNFFILKELRYVLIFLCISHFGYTASQYVKYINDISDSSDKLIIAEASLRFLCYAALFVALVVSTCYVTMKVRTILKNDAYCVRQIRDVTVVSINQSLQSNASIQSNLGYSPSQSKSKYKQLSKLKQKQITDITLSQILSNKQGFELFMRHLAFELSIECLLCFTELIQFQKYIVKLVSNHNDNNSMPNVIVLGNSSSSFTSSQTKQSLFQCIEFPDSVPNSFIVYQYIDDKYNDNKNENNLDQQLLSDNVINDENVMFEIMVLRGNKLYQKYITSNSEYQVNLAYRTRKEIEKGIKALFMREDDNNGNDNDDMESLLYLFDNACNGLYGLMKDSFRRFKKTPEFDKLQMHLFRKSTVDRKGTV